MRQLWVTTEIDAPASTVWDILVDPAQWPKWGPSVRRATVEGGALRAGARGEVETAVGVTLGFEITTYEPGARWAWKVGGVDATDHCVEELGPHRCRAGFGVGWLAAPYLVICRVALTRISQLATQ